VRSQIAHERSTVALVTRVIGIESSEIPAQDPGSVQRMPEGRIPYAGHETWYTEEGTTDPGKLPVLCLHGGPGASHDYLEPLLGLAATGRRVVLYDQIGCGKSPASGLDWTVELFVHEVDAVRDALGLERIHLFGNSWGGMLAMEYALTQPAGLESLTLASSPASIPQWVEETGKLRAVLPTDVQATLDRHEAAGTVHDEEYVAACMEFYKRHVCRVWPFPDYVERSFAQLGEVYETMNGPSEFHVVGTLREWSVVDRLGEIGVPTLVVSGEHDEATPAINRTVAEGVAGARSVILDGCSHMAHVERTEDYLALLDEFFRGAEVQDSAASGVST
jgi:L-proline amide hydrolase